jgi:uncharacterized protein (TIGR03790 family)
VPGVREIGIRRSMLTNEICYRIAGCVVALVVGVTGLSGQTSNAQIPLNKRVLVVYNSNDSASAKVAKYYAAKRNIPAANLCRISPPSNDRLSWSQYVGSVKTPVQKCLKAVGPESILYIVFTYQTPYSISGTGNPLSYSLDQYVADIWDQYSTQDAYPIPGRFHTYYDNAQSQGNVYQPFLSLADYRAQPFALTIYSVWRLDGATAALAEGLVDKAMAAESSALSGKACFDRNRGAITNVADMGYGEAEWDLHNAAKFAGMAGFTVLEDSNSAEFGTPPAPMCPNAVLYSGWYSLNHYNNAFTWNTGAIGIHLDSASALNPRGGPNWSANAIINGITVTSGSVSEPYLQGLVRPGGTFRDLLQGANVGDAFLRNTRWLKWMTLNLGDPLYRPFPNGLPPFRPLPPQASLALSSRHVLKGGSALARITLEKPAPSGGTIVSLSSSLPKLVVLPASVTVPTGATTVTFQIEIAATPSVTADAAAKITASGVGQNTLTVSPLLGRLIISPPSIVAGTTATGLIVLQANAKGGGEVVSLKTDSGSLTVPATVLVLQGKNEATFAIGSSAVTSVTTAKITATLNGASTQAAIMLRPAAGPSGGRH